MASDSEFDDDDDDILLALEQVRSRQNTRDGTPSTSLSGTANGNKTDDLQTKSRVLDVENTVYRTQGEISILRAQLDLLQRQKHDEIKQLVDAQEASRLRDEEKMQALKFTIQRLEDEKRFLNNEVRNLASFKRRRVDSGRSEDLSTTTESPVSKVSRSSGTQSHSETSENSSRSVLAQRVIKIQNDSSLFTDHIWSHCINGSRRSTLKYLSKICLDDDIQFDGFKVNAKMPVSTAITEYLMLKKSLRLDDLISDFCVTLCTFVEILVSRKSVLAVPFVISLIHGALSFRSSAVSRDLIKKLLTSLCTIVSDSVFLLDSTQDENDIVHYHDVPRQVMVLEKFALICALDTVEKLMVIASQFDQSFIKSLWDEDYLSLNLLRSCLPENTERFKNVSQINVIFNFIEILASSLTESGFAYNNVKSKASNESIINSLLKIFLIELPIKEDFMFYGLNRVVGNNFDFDKIESIIPATETILKHSMISIPGPIADDVLEEKGFMRQDTTGGSENPSSESHLCFELSKLHEIHLLHLRLKVTSLLESYVMTHLSTKVLESKECLKSIIRTIGLEQNFIMKLPRSDTVPMRIQIIASLVRLVSYICSESRGITGLIYPETLYEIYIVFSRIAFGSNSLSVEAHNFLRRIRNNGFYHPVFNASCEKKAREINHVTYSDPKVLGNSLADIESDFPNGLEFSYENETVEIAREILDSCLTREEADNLYFNMNHDEGKFDEMDLVVD
ncbi:Piso0_005614 [Millerozyma farinosa CBS 7064]|uniref:Piso0_005614 protein n=1 Tax=Pichia sorbitophila (strain ATCC MYA-4447 / BCRC 22081 / CBS 7064 / NBRC 10061 / NRRL Y-12695) TaxID=559304 RepID=G8XZG8_PICSO|nr:Piso0_005614 [Millerozyma farinosa CBS 7064]